MFNLEILEHRYCRFIYSAAGEGPLHSFVRGDKATADCHSSSMLNTFPQTCRAQTEELECWYPASFMLVPFSCFHLVKENVYPALLLIRDHCPRRAEETETEKERLLCSMRRIHGVLNWDIVTTGYCFIEKKKKCSHTVGICHPPGAL